VWDDPQEDDQFFSISSIRPLEINQLRPMQHKVLGRRDP